MLLCIEKRSFPDGMSAVACRVAALLATGQIHPPSGRFRISFGDECLEIPYRVYYTRSNVKAATALEGTAGVIAMCLGTRHYDGFLREECVRGLLMADEPWVVPFVVQLLGEYVLEIGQLIEAALPQQNPDPYIAYLRQNMAHLSTLERRAVSYWNAYYRSSFPSWNAFPAYKALAKLRRAAER